MSSNLKNATLNEQSLIEWPVDLFAGGQNQPAQNPVDPQLVPDTGRGQGPTQTLVKSDRKPVKKNVYQSHPLLFREEELGPILMRKKNGIKNLPNTSDPVAEEAEHFSGLIGGVKISDRDPLRIVEASVERSCKEPTTSLTACGPRDPVVLDNTTVALPTPEIGDDATPAANVVGTSELDQIKSTKAATASIRAMPTDPGEPPTPDDAHCGAAGGTVAGKTPVSIVGGQRDLAPRDGLLIGAVENVQPFDDAANGPAGVVRRNTALPMSAALEAHTAAHHTEMQKLEHCPNLQGANAARPIESLVDDELTVWSTACGSPPAPSPSADAQALSDLPDNGEGNIEPTAASRSGCDSDDEGDVNDPIGVKGLLLLLSGDATGLEISPDVAAEPEARKRGRKPRYAADLSEYTQPSTVNERGILHRAAYFRAVNDHRPTGDQPRLRKFWDIAEAEGLNVTEIVLTRENIARLLAKHRLYPRPKKYANQILICLRRLLETHPGLLRQQVEPETETRIAAVPYSRLPHAIQNDINAWIRMTPIKVNSGPNLAGSLTQKSIRNYVDSIRTIVAALILGIGESLDNSVGFALVAQPIAVHQWLPVLDRHSKHTTVCGHLAGLLRMMRDLPGQSQDDIEFLEARLSDRMPKPEIGADQRARLARWEEPALHACLLAAPESLMRVAEDASAGTQTRVLAGASAFAFHLMWEHPSLTQRAIVTFDLMDHVKGEPGARVVLHELPASGAQSAQWLSTPLSTEAEAMWERLLASRDQMAVPDTLLLPGEDGLARETSAGMEVIYNKIQEVLGERFIATDFRDLNKSLVVPDPDVDLDEAAAAFGNGRRALERRFAADFQSRSLSSAP